MKFRKKPVVIEAKQITDMGRLVSISVWLDAFGVGNVIDLKEETLGIQTLEGMMTASMGDWVIQGVQGEFYPCKPDIFEQTYEVAE